MAGVVHHIDRVICVRPVKQHYRPDIGDVVIGRVVSVDQQRWQVDINSYQHAVLNLTAINLPGGVQRRRCEEDKLQMREFFNEGDLILAEVQNVGSFDGKISIQTRNQKYGKVKNGVLLQIDSNFIRRMKSHILEFFAEPAIGCILGTNGYVWIYSYGVSGAQEGEVTPQERHLIAVLRNAILCLEKQKIPIFKDTIMKVLEEQINLEIKPQHMLLPSSQTELTKTAATLIEKEISAQKPIDYQKLMDQIEQNDF